MHADIGEICEASAAPTSALQKAKGQRLSLRRALDEFRAALDGPPEEAGAEWLTAALEHLRVVFGVHVEVTESPGGLYEEILEIAPRLANKIARFRREHATITATVQSALEDLDDGGAVLANELRPRLSDLHEVLARHRRRGADLVYEAYHVDIGGES